MYTKPSGRWSGVAVKRRSCCVWSARGRATPVTALCWSSSFWPGRESLGQWRTTFTGSLQTPSLNTAPRPAVAVPSMKSEYLSLCLPIFYFNPDRQYFFSSAVARVPVKGWTRTLAEPPFPSAAPGVCISMAVNLLAAKCPASFAFMETFQSRWGIVWVWIYCLYLMTSLLILKILNPV